MKTIEIQTRNVLDDPLPDQLLPAHGEVRLVTGTRSEIEALIVALTAVLVDSVSFDAPLPARRGWRAYGVVSVSVTEDKDGE